MIPEAVVAMLACARIGAVHSVVFGGFSAEALRSRIEDAEARARHHRRRRQPPRQADGAQARGRRGRRARRRRSSTCSWCAHRQDDVEWTDKDVWWHDLVGAQPTTHEAQAFDAEHPLFILYTSGTTGKPKGILHTTGGYLTQAAYTHTQRLRPQARHRRLLVHRRHRLGHRALLHRLRPAGQRRDAADVRGHPGHPAQRPLVGDRREVPRLDPLHRADRDPHVHEVGRGHPRRLRPDLAARCSGRSASRSTPRPGCGTAASSAATAARSSTPGGRPRPARS